MRMKCFCIVIVGIVLQSTFTIISASENVCTHYFEKYDSSKLSESNPGLNVTSLDYQKDVLNTGDRILAIDEIRIFDGAEYDYIRYRYDAPRDHVRLTVLRNGEIVDLMLKTIAPVRRLGFSYEVINYIKMCEILDKWKIAYNIEISNCFDQIPFRFVYLINRYLLDHPEDVENGKWVREFLKLYESLVLENWKDATQVKDIPIPEVQQLADFYFSIAQRNKNGEQDPDPSAHGVDLDYFVFCYPYPYVQIPSLGDLHLSDARFQKLLELERQGRVLKRSAFSYYERNQAASSIIDKKLIFFNTIKASLINPENHAGWPYRHKDLFYNDSRKAIIQDLRLKYNRADMDQALYAFALVGPYYRNKDLDAIFEMLEYLSVHSPYLFLRAAYILGTLRSIPELNLRMDAFLKNNGGIPLPREPKMVRYLFDRNIRSLDSEYIPFQWDAARHFRDYNGFDFYYYVYSSMQFSLPLKEWLIEFEKPLLSGADSATQKRMFAELCYKSRRSLSKPIIEIAAKIIQDKRGFGLFIDAITELCYWSRIYGLYSVTTDRILYQLAKIEYSAYTGGIAQSQFLQYEDRTMAKKSAELIYEKYGTPVVALLLADALDQMKMSEEANRYREKVYTFFRYCGYAYCKNKNDRMKWGHFLLRHCSASPATCKMALDTMNSIDDCKTEDNYIYYMEKFGGYISWSYAFLMLDKIDEAIEKLILAMPYKVEYGRIIFFRDKCVWMPDDAKSYMLQAIIQHPKFNETHKQKIINSVIAKDLPALYEKLFTKSKEENGNNQK